MDLGSQSGAPDAYILCSTPRTGSTLLCSLLRATGRAGKPESYFRSEDIERRAEDWRIREPDGSIDFRAFLRCVLDSGRTPNGIFAARIMWGTMEELTASLRSLGLKGTDREVLTGAFGETRYVYLQRQDAIAQAVSRYKAEQTDVWHITSESAWNAEETDVCYNREAIQLFLDEAVEHDNAWEQWFQRNEIEPLRVTYESLDQNKAAVIRKMLDFLGVEAPDFQIDVPNVRMADAISHEWTERFRAETGFRD